MSNVIRRTLKGFKPSLWLALFSTGAVLFLHGSLSFWLVHLPHMASFGLAGVLAAVLIILAFGREGDPRSRRGRPSWRAGA